MGGKPQAVDHSRLWHHIWMVAGVAELIEREEILVAQACNHPNCLVLRFSFPMVRVAA
jgi:hypothetical protein